MWTYLAILLSISALLAVFVRRIIFAYRGAPEEVKVVTTKDGDLSAEDLERVAELKKLSKADKQEVTQLCDKAELKIKTGQEEEAIKLLVQALAIDELHIETQHKLAMLYMKKQLFSSASALFKQLATLTGDALHYSHLGLALYQQSEFEGARNAYQKAVELDQSRPQRFASLAQVYRSMGQLQNAIIAANKALEIDQSNLEFLLLLASIQDEKGNMAEAKEILEKTLEIDPENKEVSAYLKDVAKRIKEAKTPEA